MPIQGPIRFTWDNRAAVVKLLGPDLSSHSPLRTNGITPSSFVEPISTKYGMIMVHSGDWVYRDEDGLVRVLAERIEG